MFLQLEYIDVGTPISNRYYLGCPNGEIYGLNHVKERVQPEVLMELRPDTVVPGLYLTGIELQSYLPGFEIRVFAFGLNVFISIFYNMYHILQHAKF